MLNPSTTIRIPADADCSQESFRHPEFKSASAEARATWGTDGFLGAAGGRWFFQKSGDPTPYSVEIPAFRPEIHPDLAKNLYRAVAAKSEAERKRSTLAAASLCSTLPQRDIQATERYVRSCLVSQGIV